MQELMDDYLKNGDGHMLCLKGSLNTKNLDIIIDYIKKSDRYIYLDFEKLYKQNSYERW